MNMKKWIRIQILLSLGNSVLQHLTVVSRYSSHDNRGLWDFSLNPVLEDSSGFKPGQL